MLVLGDWKILLIVVSAYLILFLLLFLGYKGHDLCHRQKKLGILFLFISLNFFGLFWANKIFKKENSNFKFWKIIKNSFKIKRKNKIQNSSHHE